MAKNRIRFTISSGNVETAHSCDCLKWIRHLAGKQLKLDELKSVYNGKFPPSRMFVLDMIEFLRKSDDPLDRFLKGRGGLLPDDLLSIDHDAVRQVLNKEFPEVAERFASERGKVIKRRNVDLTPLEELGKKRR
ncbi:hypothetical protein [Geobacter sp. DSM 9736]|uniref:hypothetical protein n=1 Tax=Geobacter sp. DSM 9736 TaxID=1277350 RepID=UPI000B510726|nr:hypothetical protein [Geobacter sp. DSM 9736]SNB45231.1 hypothetical protein SAMN06269301_0634 [Geobacter sp. DSM 9736]